MSKSTISWSRRIVSLAAGIALLWLLNYWINPVPVAAGPAFVLGALCTLLLRPAWQIASASAIGAIIGIFIHRSWHVSGQSPEPAEGLLLHLLYEGVLGMIAALACLALAWRLMDKSR